MTIYIINNIVTITVRGERNILAFCRNLIRDAKEKVIISIWDTMCLELAADLKACVDRGCNVSGITFEVENPINTLDKHRTNKAHNSIDFISIISLYIKIN